MHIDMPDPEAERACAERRELMRLAAARIVHRYESGDDVEPETLQWAQHFVRVVPALATPLSEGRRR